MAFGIPALDRMRERLLSGFISHPYNGQSVGIVYPGSTNTAVLSFSSGRVISAQYDSAGGATVVVQSNNGYQYIYSQLSNLVNREARDGGPLPGGSVIRPGDLVRAGDVLGFQGGAGQNGFAFGLRRMLGNNTPGPYVDPTGGAGQDTRGVFYRIYHALGLGSGTVGGQLTAIPDPTAPANPTPWPLPPSPGTPAANGEPGGTDPGTGTGTGYTEPGTGSGGYPTVTPVGEGGGQGGGLFGFPDLSNPGQLVNGCLMQAGVTLAMGLLGVLLLIVGLVALTKEEPVKAVVEPVEDTVKAGEKVAKTAATVT